MMRRLAYLASGFLPWRLAYPLVAHKVLREEVKPSIDTQGVWDVIHT